MFDKFNNVDRQKIIVIGDLILDKYIHGHSTRISPEAPVPIVLADNTSYVLGGAANVAANLISLGAQSILLGRIGNDLHGDILKKKIQDEIGSDLGILKTDAITTTKTRIISQNHQMLRIDEEDTAEISKEEENLFFDLIQRTIQNENISSIIFQDYNKGVLTESLIEKVIAISKKHHIPFYVDPKHNNFWEYTGAAIFKPNFSEILKANNTGDRNSFDDILLSSARKLNCKILMCTLAADGIAYVENAKVERTPTQKIDVLDVSGAGDSAFAIIVLAHLLGYDSKTISILANLCGKVVCMKSGVSTITIDELKGAFRSIQQDIAK